MGDGHYADDVRESGHNIVASVFAQCYAMYRADGPEEMKPIGESEFVVGAAAMSASGNYGPRGLCSAIVGSVDVGLGDGAAPVLEALEVAQDPVLRERGVVIELDHPEAGRFPQVGAPFHFSRTPVVVERPAPTQGQHSLEVFREFLGMTDERYDELAAKNITGQGPPA